MQEMFESEIEKYEEALKQYKNTICTKIAIEVLRSRDEILFSAHSCAIEGNSFTVGDTQELKEKGLGLIP